jgi:UDP-N-acetyl-D-mannosaminuronate dehydrogenase
MVAHQLAWAMPDVDVAEALRLAGSHWRLTPLYLGFGTGGRCVSMGSKYLAAASKGQLDLVGRAVEWDEEFRGIIANAVAAGTRPDSRVLVLGIAYRPEFKDAGLSPGLGVARRLAQRGRGVDVHDPMWSQLELAKLTGLTAVKTMTAENFQQYTAVLLATPHGVYQDWPHRPWWKPGQIVLDGQGTWAPVRGRFKEMGVRYVRVGEPGWLQLKEVLPCDWS